MYKLGNYVPGDSPVHGLDPRVKILSVVALSLALVAAGPGGALLVTGLLTALIPLSAAKPALLREALKPVRFFLLLLVLLHMFGGDGAPIPPFPVWKVTVTWEGLAAGLTVAWRFGLMVAAAAFLTMTTSPSEMVAALQKLLRPLAAFGVPTRDLATMFSLSLRFVPTLLSEIDRMKEARLARGARLSSGTLSDRLKTLFSLVIPVTLNSFKRAEELSVAMEARAYGAAPATSARELSMGRADLATAGLIAAVSILVLVL